LIIFKGDHKAAHFLTRFSNVIEKGAGQKTHYSNMNDLSELGCKSAVSPRDDDAAR